MKGYLPLLDTVEALQGRDGDKDDNSLLAVANLDLIKIQSQHASSRTKPWTASRPVPQKSINSGWHDRPGDTGCASFDSKSILSNFSECASGDSVVRHCMKFLWEQDFEEET